MTIEDVAICFIVCFGILLVVLIVIYITKLSEMHAQDKIRNQTVFLIKKYKEGDFVLYQWFSQKDVGLIIKSRHDGTNEPYYYIHIFPIRQGKRILKDHSCYNYDVLKDQQFSIGERDIHGFAPIDQVELVKKEFKLS